MGIIKSIYIDKKLSQNTNMEPLIINNQQKCTVKDVPAKEFIEAFARHLKKGNKIKMPDWATYYKTACFKDLAPYDADWLYIRAASIAYQLYMRGKVGVNTLRKHYSGKHRRGTLTEHSRLTAGKCIRYCLVQLEKAQIVGQMSYEDKNGSESVNGKALTKKGITDMDRIAAQIVK